MVQETVDTQSTQINKYLNETLEGIPEEIATNLLESIAYFGEVFQEEPDEDEATHRSNEEDAIGKLRYSFTTMLTFLIENRLGEMNDSQRVFFNTGAVADIVTFEYDEGEQYTVQLLAPNLYQALRQVTLDTSNIPEWANVIYRPEDKCNAIALGVLEPAGLDKKSLAKFRSTRGQDAQKGLSLDQTTALNNSYESQLRIAGELMEEVKGEFGQYYECVRKIPELQALLDKSDKYRQLIADRGPTQEVKMELRGLTNDKAHAIGNEIGKYADNLVNILNRLKDGCVQLDEKHRQLKETTANIVNAGVTDVVNVRNRLDILFDYETVRLIKTDTSYTGNFAVSSARNHSNRITESTSRVLLDIHSERVENPMAEGYCTIQNITKSIEKLIKLHTNLFPSDDNGHPIIPPFIIEPIRNYVEWNEDRFVINLVSGEPHKKGPKVSLTPVDVCVLRCFGHYAFKDAMYDYRGNRVEGNLMADYSGKIESKTKVSWQGDDKKFKLVASAQEVDSANRDTAVEDYMAFLFAAVNDFPPPTGLSKRKIAVMLRYMVIDTIERTIGLALRYVADKEPEEAKTVIMHYAEKDRNRAKELIDEAIDANPSFFPEGKEVYYGKILGSMAV